jgi:NitT/TauT family transport system permease protein
VTTPPLGPRVRQLGPNCAGVAMLLALFEVIGRTGLFGPTWPALSAVGKMLRDETGPRAALARATVATADSAACGLGIGTALGLALAAVALVPVLSEGLQRLAALIHAVPLVALGPILIAVAGRTQTPMVVAALASGFAMFVAGISGVRAAAPVLSDLFTVFGATRRLRALRLQIPAALPTIVSGLTVAAPAAVLGAVVGEWFGASRGLGVLLVSAMNNFQISMLWAAAFVCAAMSLLLYFALCAAQVLANRFLS